MAHCISSIPLSFPLRRDGVRDCSVCAAFEEGILGEPDTQLGQVRLAHRPETLQPRLIRQDQQLCLVAALWRASGRAVGARV